MASYMELNSQQPPRYCRKELRKDDGQAEAKMAEGAVLRSSKGQNRYYDHGENFHGGAKVQNADVIRTPCTAKRPGERFREIVMTL